MYSKYLWWSQGGFALSRPRRSVRRRAAYKTHRTIGILLDIWLHFRLGEKLLEWKNTNSPRKQGKIAHSASNKWNSASYMLGSLAFCNIRKWSPGRYRIRWFHVFADDSKMFRMIASTDDCNILQRAIDTLESWSDKWLLKFHRNRCHVVSLGKVENILHYLRYSICELEMEHVFEENDLGVIVDADIVFEEHISKKVTLTNAMVKLIWLTFFLSRPSNVCQTFYCICSSSFRVRSSCLVTQLE